MSANESMNSQPVATVNQIQDTNALGQTLTFQNPVALSLGFAHITPGDLPGQGTKLGQVDSLPLNFQGSPKRHFTTPENGECLNFRLIPL